MCLQPLILSPFKDHRRVLAKLPGGLLCGSVAHSASKLLPGHHASHHGGRHRWAECQRVLCVQPAGEQMATKCEDNLTFPGITLDLTLSWFLNLNQQILLFLNLTSEIFFIPYLYFMFKLYMLYACLGLRVICYPFTCAVWTIQLFGNTDWWGRLLSTTGFEMATGKTCFSSCYIYHTNEGCHACWWKKRGHSILIAHSSVRHNQSMSCLQILSNLILVLKHIYLPPLKAVVT